MVDVLLAEKVFCHTLGRYHEHFKEIKGDPLAKLKSTPAKLNVWLKSKVKELALDQELQSQL